MGERRKRRSLWDKEAEAKHFSGSSENNYLLDSGQYHEFSPSGSYRADDIRYQSGQPSLESIEENPITPTNGNFNKGRESAPEQKEIGGENKYYQKMSPEFKFSHSLGNDRSHSQRYTERGRSRSRSRSRSRGRSRSRSLSRGREKERVRGRSRSRDDGVARDQRSWRNRADHGHISRHSYSSRGSRSELRGDVSDPFQGEDEQLQNKSRGAGPCKDFIKGKCRWGDTCRFSHHFASNETFGKGTRYSSSDKDNEQKSYKHGKPLCKYFAAGKCDRNNCRFSHEDLRFNSLEGREGKFTDDDSFYNKGNRRDDLSWRDTTRITDNIKPSGWNESIVTVTNNNGDNINWGTPERADNLLDPNNRTSPPARSDTYSGDLGTNASTVKENMADKQAEFILHGSQLQNQDGLNVQGQHGLGVDQQFSVETWQNVSQVPHIQQQAHGLIDNKPVSVSGSYVVEEVNDPSNYAYPITDSAQNLSQSGENVFSRHSSIPNQTDSGPYPDHPNLVANLNLQPQMQDHQNAIQTIESSETRVLHFTPNLATSEHSAQFGNSMVSLTGQQVPLVETKNTQFSPFRVSHDPINPTEGDRGANDHGNQMQVGQSPPSSNAGVGPDNWKDDHSGRSRLEQDVVFANSQVNEGKRAIGEESKDMKNNKQSETLDGHGKAEEINANKDDKGMRLFKNSLIEFVKDILKPTWKEGRMSREVHKTIVKKVVDKITSTIQVDHIPRTQEKVEQYLSFSKPKIAKLVQAYVGRCLKADS